ncbi:MAG TPA: Asp-tRNA(Asn)/Glu-tRNA(Gln) amidotransferase subunit GatA [bacterium]|nr:Asp-tRNA(Asn)/Glu-tRNA(Gln) amidotransferase subunit GatA [bacterium]
MAATNPALVLDDLEAIHSRAEGGDTPEGILGPYRHQFERHDPGLRAYLEPAYGRPLADPGPPRATSETPLLLAPFALKDNFALEGTACTCGSNVLKDFRPAYTATVVQRLLTAGALCVGKTNLDEFAMGSSTEFSAFGATRNPWDPTRTAGGSSGGSAVAVAAGMAAFALGSDTGGSVRQPAAFTGIVGFKPSYGRYSRYGLVAFASSLDHPSTFTRTVRDTARLYQVMAGPDPLDATTLPAPGPLPANLWEWDGAQGLRVGILKQCTAAGLDPDVAAGYARTRELFTAAGAEIVELDCPVMDQAVSVYYVIAPAEASSNLARYDGIRFGPSAGRSAHQSLEDYYGQVRTAGFGPEVTRRILTGTFVLSSGYYDAYYLKASQIRALFQRQYADFFTQVDIILLPTTPTLPFKLGEKVDDPVAMYLNDLFTIPANLTGAPALSLPVGWSDAGLPVGMQLMTKRLDEETLFRVAHWLESRLGFTPRLPN